ncbi:MAG: family 16 glycosylhydrolase [Terrisporobacter sp.]|uniref:family 16 glycosylhydrolase n=1 Tax=Terrisporobacter sp. TaxID=1965305 RepID=UPI00399AFB77
MAYKKKVWKTGDIMKQEDINNIENGIYEAHQELKNLHNYDDTEIKNIIGSGTLSTLAKDLKGAINEVFQYASNGKTLIAQAITGKGVATSNTDTFQTMATNISLISGKVTGKILTLDNKKYTLSEDDNGNITATIIKFSITNKLTNVSNSNSAIQVDYGNSYSATITANSGYEINSLSITMGGVDITSTAFNNNEINISKVTGDLIISISATETLTISNISNLTQPEKSEFYIEYSTNIAVTKHEVSWDGGNTFYDKTSDVTANGTSYKFKHDNNGSAGTYSMAIRVTTAKGTTKTSNVFTVTLVDNNQLVFTQYKRLNDGVIADTTDGKYYSTLNYINVIANKSYTLNLNKANYVCICYYNSSNSYVSFVEGNTDDWSNKALSYTFTVPANITKMLICATGDASTAITGTLKENNNSDTGTSSLLDSTGAYVIDDFSGSSVDSNKWGYELGYVRNNETQRYTNTNAEINDGILALRGKKASDGSWTSASIISKGHFAFMYGKIEARVKLCNLNGAFGAFWTLGDSFEFGYKENASPDTLGEWWAYCGEFDIVEFYNKKLTCGVFFNQKEESGRVWYDNYATGDWHIFAMEWATDGSLKFTIDGNVLSTTSATDNRAFHIPHYILLNQAIGASGGTPDSSTTEITQYVDWVKYYPLSTENVVRNSSDFTIQATDFNENNCVVRATFNDNCINKALSWESNNESVITVHSGFCVAASSSGSATITATSKSGVSKSITLNVSNNAISH